MKSPTYHLKLHDGRVACSAVPRWPDHAAVPRDIFARKLALYGTRTCARCKQHPAAPAPLKPQRPT